MKRKLVVVYITADFTASDERVGSNLGSREAHDARLYRDVQRCACQSPVISAFRSRLTGAQRIRVFGLNPLDVA